MGGFYMLKKAFCLALGALLVIAFTAPVMAETKVDFSGTYRVRAHYYNNLNLSDESDSEEKSSYFDQRFRAAFKIMPSESLTLNIATQALDNKWGTSVYSKRYQGEVGASSGLEVYYAHMDIKTSFGLFSIGRQSAGVAGFAALGYHGSTFNASDVFDTETPQMRIKYILPSGPFTLFLTYEKITETDWNTATKADQDYDAYYAMGQYKWANGGANLLLAYRKDATATMIGAAPPGVDDYDVTAFVVNPSIVMNFGPVGIHGEMAYLTGEAKWGGGASALGLKDADLEGLGFYLDGTYNYGPGVVGLQYFWIQGDDDATDNTIKGSVPAGGDFNPLFLVTNVGISAYDITNGNNYWMLAAWVDHNITEDLLLHAAVGYFGINEPGKKALDPTSDADKSYGTELNVGLNYNIMSNLSWELQLAYFMAGDFIKDKNGVNDVGNAYAMRNVLTLKF